MTKKIRDKLIEAYSHFSEGIHEGRYESAKMFGEEIKGIRVSLEDYKMLKPFVQAHSMKVFNVNGIELKLSYGASFYSVEDNDGVLLCAVKEEAILEAYTDLYTMIKLAISSRLASKHFYTEGGNGCD